METVNYHLSKWVWVIMRVMKVKRVRHFSRFLREVGPGQGTKSLG
jgi:hypothetical protein